MIRRLTSKLRSVLLQGRVRRAVASSNPFSTHLPILTGLGVLFPIHRVLELGGGLYSTAAFLDRATFPALEALDTYENDEEWARQLAERFSDDRHRLVVHAGDMRLAVPDIPFEDYDLVFVDDSKSYSERARTIAAITNRFAAGNLIVIHDYEAPEYVAAARGFPRTFCFNSYLPHTGIAWSDGRVNARRLKALDRTIRRHARSVEAEDVAQWRQIFRADPRLA
jgi:predicted O-methyltransferase YrrM